MGRSLIRSPTLPLLGIRVSLFKILRFNKSIAGTVNSRVVPATYRLEQTSAWVNHRSLPSNQVTYENLGGMDMHGSMTSMHSPSSNTTMMGMDAMAMTFFTATTTPLFSKAWTPKSTGQYAGTCIFLIALAAVFRALLALRVNLFRILDIVEGPGKKYAQRNIEEGKPRKVRSWRAKEAVWLASMDVLLGGVGYLLMVAVMTMNVGYFLSVLGGIFLGSLVFGQYLAPSPVA